MPQTAPALRNEGSRTQVVVAGAIAGLVSRFVIAPLDVVKIRLQLQTHSLSDPLSHPSPGQPIYKGTLPTLFTILRQEGLTALWKGNLPAEALYLSYGALQFLSYRSASQALAPLDLPAAGTSFIAGAAAGTVATTATYPLDLLRTRFAAQGAERVYSSLYAGVREIYRREGAGGFFRGLGAGVGQTVPYMGLFFTLYEGCKPAFASVQLPFDWLGSGEALAGITASVLSKTAVFPLDTVRKRLQVQGPSREKYVHRNIPVYDKGVFGTLGAIASREGIRGLYRGLPASLIKAAPASAVTVWTYERALAAMMTWDEI